MRVTVKAKRQDHWRGGHFIRARQWQELEVDAAALRALKADADIDIKAVLQEEQPQEEPQSETNPDAEALAALANLTAEDMTTAGKPKAEALERVLGRKVNAAERNRLWATYQATQAG